MNTVSTTGINTTATGAATPKYSRFLVPAFLLLGIFLRLYHFFDNRSLYLDEVFLASSLIRMNFIELVASNLDYQQKAPIGFLWAVKLCVVLFGKNEMALRLFPLLCGIGSLFLFVPVARYFLKPLGVVLALGILALAPPLVYHDIEIKQYGTEMFATILCLYLFIRYHRQNNTSALLWWGLAGAAIIWFSYTSIFILAGIAGGVSLYLLFKRNWAALFRSFIPFILWMVSFGINYFLFTYKHAADDQEWLVIWFKVRGGFMPLLPRSAEDLWWFYRQSLSMLHYPLGLTWYYPPGNVNPVVRLITRMVVVPLFFMVVGVIALFRANKKEFLALTFPFILALLASGLEVYPIFDRTIVYLAPLLILFIAKGVDSSIEMFRLRPFWKPVFAALLLAGPLFHSLWQVADTRRFADYKKSYQKEVLQQVNQQYQPGDVVYAYWTFLPGYRYYKSAYGLKYNAIEGKDYRMAVANEQEYFQRLGNDLNALKGSKRVWLLYHKGYVAKIGDVEGTPDWYYRDNNEFDLLKKLHAEVRKYGKEVKAYDTYDATAVLFDFSTNP